MAVQTPDFSEFPKQFVIGTGKLAAPAGRVMTTGETTLLAAPDLAITTLVGHDGRGIGYLLGHAIDGATLLVDSASVSVTDWDGLLSWRHGLTGSFVILAHLEGETRLYPDAGGLMSSVYSTAQRTAASSIGLLPDANDSDNDIDEELVDLLNIPNEDNWYPFGLTQRKSVRRLLPNHYLDLETFTATRFRRLNSAQTATARQAAPPAADIVDQIRKKTAAFIGTLSRAFPTKIGLTAGRDSRMLLTAAIEAQADIAYYTSEKPDWTAFQDVVVATRLCQKLNLRHDTISHVAAPAELLDLWQRQVGGAVGGRTWRGAASGIGGFRDDKPAILAGLAAEVGRAYYWKREDAQAGATALSPEDLLERMDLPVAPILLDAASSWLTDFDGQDSFDILDWLYTEQRLGCWAGPMRYGLADRHICYLSPFNSEWMFDRFALLPQEYRMEQGLYGDFVRTAPDVLKTQPVNAIPRADKAFFIATRPRTYLRYRRTVF